MSARLFNGLYFHFSIRWSVRSSARLSVINFCQNWLISTFLKKYFYIELTSPKWSKLKERNSLNKFYFSGLSPKDYPKSYFLDSLKKVNFMFIQKHKVEALLLLSTILQKSYIGERSGSQVLNRSDGRIVKVVISPKVFHVSGPFFTCRETSAKKIRRI